MKNFFEDKHAELKEELESWLYTPYRHWSGVKGVGTDCIHFVCRVYETFGACPVGGFQIPYYPKAWNLKDAEELLLDGVLEQMNVVQMPLVRPENGNLYLFHFGKTISHAAIYCDGNLYQAITGKGVRKLTFNDRKWHKRKRYNFMIIGANK